MYYYKRNIGDYYKKAGRLTMLQHGAYVQLIDACYDREKFPTKEEAIEWVWASSADEIEAVNFVLKRFFIEESGVFVQLRIKEEIEHYRKIGEKNRKIAFEREARKRKERDGDSTNRGDESTNRDSDSTKRARSDHEETTNEHLTKNQEPITSKKTNKKDLMSDESDVGVVLGYFNQVCSQKLKVTTKAHTQNINARLNDGYTVEDCKAVIDFKYRDWAGTKQAQYLRPCTLFAASKFPGYLQGSKSANLPKTEKHDVSPSEAFRLELAAQGRRVDF